MLAVYDHQDAALLRSQLGWVLFMDYAGEAFIASTCGPLVSLEIVLVHY